MDAARRKALGDDVKGRELIASAASGSAKGRHDPSKRNLAIPPAGGGCTPANGSM
jgi:hypothetical protein